MTNMGYFHDTLTMLFSLQFFNGYDRFNVILIDLKSNCIYIYFFYFILTLFLIEFAHSI